MASQVATPEYVSSNSRSRFQDIHLKSVNENSSTMTNGNADLENLLRTLSNSSNGSGRLEALDRLSSIIRRYDGRLPLRDPLTLFQALSLSLLDQDWEMRHRSINLVLEMIPRYHGDIDSFMSVVQHLVPLLGDKKVTIRRAATQCIHTYMKYAVKFEVVLKELVRCGLEHPNTDVQRECCVALPLLLTSDFAKENYSTLVVELSKKLVSPVEAMSKVALKALECIRVLVGNQVFETYLQSLSNSMNKYYRRVSSQSNQSTASSSTLSSSSDSQTMVSNPPVNLQQKFPESKSTAPEYSESTNTATRLAFGIVPRSIMTQLDDSEDFRLRAVAVEELLACVNSLDTLEALRPHLQAFFTFLHSLLDDTNFKITTVTLEILVGLVNRLGVSAKPYLRQITSAMTKRLGDNKIVVRQGVMKLAILLMQIFNPQHVLDYICENLNNRNSRIRQEAINIVIGSLLTFPRVDFELSRLCNAVAPSLVDSKRQVRHAALDCMSVLAQSLGAGKLEPLVQAVHGVERAVGGDGVLKAVQARLSRRQLPRLNQDGLVDYATSVPSSASRSSYSLSDSSGSGIHSLGADSEWILAARSSASSARSRPAELIDIESEGQSLPTERRKMSAGKSGKNKLPWAETKTSASANEQINVSDNSASQAPFSKAMHVATPRLSGGAQPNGEFSYAVAIGGKVHRLTDIPVETRRQPARLVNKIRSENLASYAPIGLEDSQNVADSTEGSYSYKFMAKRSTVVDSNPFIIAPPPSTKLETITTSKLIQSTTSRAVKHKMSAANDVASGIDNESPTVASQKKNNGFKSDGNKAPLPLKPQMVRSSEKKGAQMLVPPIAKTDGLNDVDSPFRSKAVPRGNHEDMANDYEMANSLLSIRTSASKKKALKVFVDAERKVKMGSGSDDDEGLSILSRRSTQISSATSSNYQNEVITSSRTKFNPYNGATFKENPFYDGKVIGRGYSDEASELTFNAGKSLTSYDSSPNLALGANGGGGGVFTNRRGSNGSVEIPIPKPRALGRRQPVKSIFDASFVRNNDDVVVGNVGGEPTSRRNSRVSDALNTKLNDGIVGVGFTTGLDDEEDEAVPVIMNMSRGLQERLVNKRQQQVEQQLRKLQQEHAEEEKQKELLEREKSEQVNELENTAKDFGKPPTAPSTTTSSKKTRVPLQQQQQQSNSPQAANRASAGGSQKFTGDAESGPIQNPEKAIGEALAAMQDEDWERKCEGLFLVRRLAEYHPETLARDLHTVVINVNREMKNLRSMVARTAIQCQAHLFRTMRRLMDPDLDQVAKILLSKAGESNDFIREDVNAALAEIVEHLNPQRVCATLVAGGAQHKNTLVRRVTAQYLCDLCIKMGQGKILSGIKDVTDKVLPAIAQFTGDGNPETRYFGRKMVYNLMGHEEFERVCKKYLAANSWRNIQGVISNLKSKGLGEMPSAAPSAGLRRSDSLSRTTSANSVTEAGATTDLSRRSSSHGSKITSFDGQESVEKRDNLIKQLIDKDWRVRQEGINELIDLVEINTDFIGAHIVKIFDAFAPRLKDANNKIAIQALSAFHTLVPQLHHHLHKVVNLMVQSVANNTNLASQNPDIRRATTDLIDSFMVHMDAAILLLPFVQASSQINKNNKSELIDLITQLCEKLLNQRKLRLVTLHVEPELWRLLNSLASGVTANTTADCQAAVGRLVRLLYFHNGEDLVDRARQANNSPQVLQLLQEMLDETT